MNNVTNKILIVAAFFIPVAGIFMYSKLKNNNLQKENERLTLKNERLEARNLCLEKQNQDLFERLDDKYPSKK